MPTDDIEVIHMTALEWDQALTTSLNALGLTWEQLTEQAKTGDFVSLKARQLWLMAGGQGPNQAEAELAELRARTEHAEGQLSALRDHGTRWELERARADKAEAKLASLQALADRLREKDWAYAAERIAERDEARRELAEAKRWHDTYQSEVNARDEFFGDLLELLPGAEDEGMDAYDQIPRAIKALRAERDQLRQHILDIDAHATPYEDLPDDPGYVGLYLLTSGALHRALGKVGHTAVPCQDAKKVAEVMEKLEEADRSNRQVEAERDALKAELAAMKATYARAWEIHDEICSEAELAEARAAIVEARKICEHAYRKDKNGLAGAVLDELATALDAAQRPEDAPAAERA